VHIMASCELEKSVDAPEEDSERKKEPDGVSSVVSDEKLTEKEPCLSKRARRKLLKKQKWLERKPLKRKLEKEKKKARKLEAKLNNLPLGPSRKKLKECTMADSQCKVKVIIDFSFDDLMSPKDIHKGINQLCRCYAVNRRSGNPVQFYVTSFSGASCDVMKKNNGYENWDVNFSKDHYLTLFNNEDIVYLTSESDNVITELNEDKAYVIGGLVDHNAHKGLTLNLAIENNLAHGRLPIDLHIEMKTRQVLTVDHVFHILLLVANGTSWKDAFLRVIPQRKGALPKEESSADSQGSPLSQDNSILDAQEPS